MLAPSASMKNRIAMYNGNALKLGLFGANCSSGRAVTTVPERWSALGRQPAAGASSPTTPGSISCSRSGAGKATAANRISRQHVETITWATGLLGRDQTDDRVRYGARAAFIPLIAAKQIVTADHVGHGRFGLNIVCGWNEGEFDMFGVEAARPRRALRIRQEWLDIVKQTWTRDETSTTTASLLQLKGVRGKPKPYGGTWPLTMNAGASGAGRAFAVRNCDAFFGATSGSRSRSAAPKSRRRRPRPPRKHGRDIEVFTVGLVVCRPTRKEAEEYHST